ncbi:MarR family winged helix-turn-helix transcriptional regulator [Nocardia sp. IFM 10818]
MGRSPDQQHLGDVPLPPTVQAEAITHALLRVMRLHRLLAKQLLRRIGLHPGQELVMMQLWDLGPQRQTDLVRMLDSDAATIARTVKRLEHAGFVRRRPSREDGRVTIIEPTRASLAVRDQVRDAWAQLEAGVTGRLDSAERTETIRLLAKIEDSLNAATVQQSPSSAIDPTSYTAKHKEPQND